MSVFILQIVEGVFIGVLTAAIIALCKLMFSMRAEQRTTSDKMQMSILSMQKAEILRMFQRIVEDGKPVTLEEMEHLEHCYNAYTAAGGNGTGALLYNRILEYAVIKTKSKEDTNAEHE